MFIFEKLEVYKKSLDYNELLLESITLNIAEGSGRFTQRDKNNFYINARGSIHECVACLDIIFDSEITDNYLNMAEELEFGINRL